MHSLQHIEQLLERPELRKWPLNTVAAAVLVARSLRGQWLDTGGDLGPASTAVRRGWAAYVRCRSGRLIAKPTLAGKYFAKATMLAILAEMSLKQSNEGEHAPAVSYALRAACRSRFWCREGEEELGLGITPVVVH